MSIWDLNHTFQWDVGIPNSRLSNCTTLPTPNAFFFILSLLKLYLFILKLYYYLFFSKEGWGRKRLFHLLTHSPSGLSAQCWTRHKQRPGNPSASRMWGVGSSTEASGAAFSRGWMHSRTARSQPGTGVLDATWSSMLVATWCLLKDKFLKNTKLQIAKYIWGASDRFL